MIDFSYSNGADISLDKKEIAKQSFIDKLGTLRNEFDEKNGNVTINFLTIDGNSFDFSFDVEGRQDFTRRWNEYIRQYKDGLEVH